MKRIASIVMTAMLLTIFSVSTVFAAASDGFELVSTNPEDGFAKVANTNVMVKLMFSEDVSAKDTQTANKDMFKFTDGDGKAVPFEIIYNSKDSKNINILADGDLEMEKSYTLTINGELASDGGSVLGADQTVKFSTQGNSSGLGYMVLMGIMVVVMIVMTIRDQKKNMETEQAKNPIAAVQTNPYKLAKEKNISVDEAVKLIEAEKVKAQKKAEKINKKQQETAAAAPKKNKEKPKKKVYKVKTKRTVKMHK